MMLTRSDSFATTTSFDSVTLVTANNVPPVGGGVNTVVVISDQEDDEDDGDLVEIHDDGSSPMEETGILIVAPQEGEDYVYTSTQDGRDTPTSFSIPESVPSNMDSITIEAQHREQGGNNEGTGGSESSSVLTAIEEEFIGKDGRLRIRISMMLALACFLFLSFAPAIYLLWDRDQLKATTVRLEEQLRQLNHDVQEAKRKYDLEQELKRKREAEEAEFKRKREAEEAEFKRRREAEEAEFKHKREAEEAELKRKRKAEEAELKKKRKAEQAKKKRKPKVVRPPNQPRDRFPWEESNKNGYSRSSDYEGPRIDNCWVHAKANFKLGECAAKTKKEVKKGLKKVTNTLWSAQEDLMKKLREQYAESTFFSGPTETRGDDQKTTSKKTVTETLWEAQEGFMKTLREQYAESSFFGGTAETDKTGDQGDKTGTRDDKTGTRDDKTANSEDDRTINRPVAYKAKEKMHTIGKVATNLVTGATFIVGAAVIVSAVSAGALFFSSDNDH